ncbi:MAG TPA: fluoride efflux transporter CrcB [Clostridia bacterium]|nr:fluoride efflux transporter CrcB [Clostridia bacterium]
MKYFIVGVGGMLGGITRYALGKWISERCTGIIPIGTLLINISGAFLLGIVSSMYLSKENLYLLLAEGYLGAYTTFSTFMYEGYNLYREDERKSAVIYILGTLLLGMIGFITGGLLVYLLK